MPVGLSKLLSGHGKQKENKESGRLTPASTKKHEESLSDRNSNEGSLDLKSNLADLGLSHDTASGTQTSEDIAAHLKVLECFYRHKEKVSSTDGLFGIHDALVPERSTDDMTDDTRSILLIKLAEKRWAVYVTRAVDRFEQWFEAIAPSDCRPTMAEIERDGRAGLLVRPDYSEKSKTSFEDGNLPPIDIVMVWHAYVLSSRHYLEDCIRCGKMQLWHAGFPLKTITECIGSENAVYNPGNHACAMFSSMTNLPWDAMDTGNTKSIECPACRSSMAVPWTTMTDSLVKQGLDIADAVHAMLSDGQGYCDRNFSASCPSCHASICHDTLRAGKLRADIAHLIDDRQSMPGTVLNLEGIPFRVDSHSDEILHVKDYHGIHGLFLAGLGQRIVKDSTALSMQDVSELIMAALDDKDYMRKARQAYSFALPQSEKAMFNKMMKCYDTHSSTISLDLVSAVVRQGMLAEKIHHTDWQHHATPTEIAEFTRKYERFLRIARDNNFLVVPTLDVDLVWHTRALSPPAYLEASLASTNQVLEHACDLSEAALNEGLAQTAKAYQKACKRDAKKGLKPAPTDNYYSSGSWSSPATVAAYSPYVGPLPVTPEYYPMPSTCLFLDEAPAAKPRTGIFYAMGLGNTGATFSVGGGGGGA